MSVSTHSSTLGINAVQLLPLPSPEAVQALAVILSLGLHCVRCKRFLQTKAHARLQRPELQASHNHGACHIEVASIGPSVCYAHHHLAALSLTSPRYLSTQRRGAQLKRPSLLTNFSTPPSRSLAPALAYEPHLTTAGTASKNWLNRLLTVSIPETPPRLHHPSGTPYPVSTWKPARQAPLVGSAAQASPKAPMRQQVLGSSKASGDGAW